MTQGKRRVRQLLARHGVNPSKRLGQNFVVDPNLIAKIVSLSGVGPGDKVVEVGPGTGALTRGLAESASRVQAYEIDSRLVTLLEESTADLSNVEIRQANALELDWNEELEGAGWIMVANLPYNVGTPLLLTVLHGYAEPVKFVVMMQSEVIDRLAAAPGSRTYGVPSVGAQLYATVSRVLTVAPQVFFPRPSVQSAVAVLDRTSGPDPLRAEAYRLARVAFNQRRKMLRVSLAAEFRRVDEVLTRLGIDPTARPEEVAVADFLRLAAEGGVTV